MFQTCAAYYFETSAVFCILAICWYSVIDYIFEKYEICTWASITCSDPRPSAKSYAFGGDTLKIPDDVDYAYMGIKKQKASNFRFFPFPLFTYIVSDFSDPA